MRVSEMAQKLGLPEQQIRQELTDLERDGLATRIDGDEWDLTDKGDQWASRLTHDYQRTDSQSSQL